MGIVNHLVLQRYRQERTTKLTFVSFTMILKGIEGFVNLIKKATKICEKIR